MLTDIFYYSYYKPYIVKDSDGDKTREYKKRRLSFNSEGLTDKAYLLNQAEKSFVIEFMRDLSSNINHLREMAKNLEVGIEKYRQNVYYGKHKTSRTWIENDFEEFAKIFNSLYSFLQKYGHSVALMEFAETLAEHVFQAVNRINFFDFDEWNNIKFISYRFNISDTNSLVNALSIFGPVAGAVKDEADAFLFEPLTKHMVFKDLEYYYNYKFGNVKESTFKIIENGVLFDLII